jgi:hypothetical protein
MKTEPTHTEEPIDITDPTIRAAWLGGLRSQLEDLIGAAMDATEPPARRDFGRRTARRIIGDAADNLRKALDVAGAPALDEADRAILPTRKPRTAPPLDA